MPGPRARRDRAREPDPRDRRAKLVTYTATGWECVRAGEQHIRDVAELLASVLGERRLAELRELLGSLVDALAAASGE